jgi:hypothetical protein
MLLDGASSVTQALVAVMQAVVAVMWQSMEVDSTVAKLVISCTSQAHQPPHNA